MKRILVPTDFSNNAYSALFYATRLFQDQECHFCILNTFDVDTPVLTSRMNTAKGDSLYQQLSNESQEKLTETLHSIVRDTEDLNHTFETISVSKKLTDTINKTIKSKKIDLVVMGTKGASGAKEVLIGSNTVKVIKKIKDCTILAVPDEFDFKKPIEIGFATDFKCLYTIESLKPLLEIVTVFSSNIRVMHIHEEEKLDEIQEHNLKSLKENLKGHNYCIHWIPRFTQKAKLINEFIDEMNIDMLCMSQYKHSLMESIVHEPVIKKIGFHLSVPFLVIPEPS
ncbi:nucleotide-binding universal stress UspA family protein [Aquimarina sp. MAR_2010_214]|uniref:universal stress protein n=1 Tax=Aquimarina sp. MAR_2010_214 TaxID=1250026 RepID=UPI000C7077D0|nr:universal stress protein [Aquimarina sp. MAR_2010_214]PKV48283.1 nucleotide-binding universal stress UspA family protein [Aquimarina sp. MAR_2010_214]